mgnify:CR=1 FL=1
MVTTVASHAVQPAGSPPAGVAPVPEPRLSVVVPVYNEAENVLPLLAEIRAALSVAVDYEVVFVDDCSDDGTADRLAPERGAVRIVRHSTRSGQSAAVRTGVRAARGTWIATLDGDGQNDPADIPNLLDLAMMVASVCEMLNRFPRVLDVPAQDPALGPVLATVIESATVNEGANVRATVDVHACCTWS